MLIITKPVGILRYDQRACAAYMRYLAAGQVFMQVDQVFLEIIEVLALSPVIREFLKVTEVMSAFLPVDVFQFHLMILKMTAFSIPSTTKLNLFCVSAVKTHRASQ